MVFTVQTGADSARLLKQWYSFGFKDQIPLLASQNVTDQSVIRHLEAEECEGVMSSSHFAEGLDNQKTRDFVETYQAEYKQLPGIFAAEGFTGGLWLADALQKIEGKAEDTDALIATLIAEEVEGSPLGDIISLDSYGNPVFDMYVRKVVKQADGTLVNEVVETYPQVSQFWTYDPEEFMKEPPYSRDYQGIKQS